VDNHYSDVLQKYQAPDFRRAVIRRDEPNFSYGRHYHLYGLVFEVLEGELRITTDHHTTTLGPGDHALIPVGALHEVRVGSSGCVYIHAEKAEQR